MRSVGVRAATALLAVAFGVLWQARADDDVPARAGSAQYLLFASTDLWRNGAFLHSGVVWSPGGIDNEGFALKAMFGGGEYRYTSGALGNVRVRGRMLAAAILPGWRFKTGVLTATVYGGLDVQNHWLSPDDPSAGLRGSRIGLRSAIELWYHWSATSMLAFDASVSSVGPSYSVRGTAGWRAFDWFYLGPEISAFGHDGNYRQLRAGAHVTALKAAALEWSAALGVARDSDHRTGPYARLGVLARR
jgi:hypothetical protein